MKSKFSNTALCFCALFLIAAVLIKPRYTEKYTNAAIAWDVSGYYLYLPALFIYDDIKKVNFLSDIIEKYVPTPHPDQAYTTGNGNKVMKYPAGMAVLYSPAFFAAHIYAKTSGYPADGFSLPYQIALQIWSVLFVIIGLFFLKKILSKYFSDKTAGWVLILIAIGTNFLNYATFDAANTHSYLFTLFAVLTWSTIRFYETEKWKYALSIGASIGLAALARPTELMYAMIPVLWGIGNLEDIKNRFLFFKNNMPKILAAVIVVAAIGSIQLIYWKAVSGHWLEYSYQDQGFSFLSPHFSDVFFSYRKGWFIYTPLMLLSIVGFYFLYKKYKKIFPAIFIFFLINTWVICAWDIWWYGGAFGQRAFVQSYVLLAFPLAAFFEWMASTRHKIIKSILIVFISGCVALNLFQTYQAHWGPFEVAAMNRAFYWRIFANTKYDPYDRLLLDTNEGFSGERKNVELIYENNFENENDTSKLTPSFPHSGKWSHYTNTAQEFSPGIHILKKPEMEAGKWLHIYASFYSPKMIWDYWHMPQFVVKFIKNNKPVKERFIRPFRVMQPNKWSEAGMDLRIPKEDFDYIEIFLWNVQKADAIMVMDDLKIEMFGFQSSVF